MATVRHCVATFGTKWYACEDEMLVQYNLQWVYLSCLRKACLVGYKTQAGLSWLVFSWSLRPLCYSLSIYDSELYIPLVCCLRDPLIKSILSSYFGIARCGRIFDVCSSFMSIYVWYKTSHKVSYCRESKDFAVRELYNVRWEIVIYIYVTSFIFRKRGEQNCHFPMTMWWLDWLSVSLSNPLLLARIPGCHECLCSSPGLSWMFVLTSLLWEKRYKNTCPVNLWKK